LKKNKTKSIILIVLLAGIVIAACFFCTSKQKKENEISLGIYVGSNWINGFRYGYTYIDKLIERYEEKNPGIKVVYRSGTLNSDYSEWISEQLLSGEAPDVFVILNQDFETWASTGALKNLDEYIENDATFDTSTYYPSVLRLGRMNGHQYAIPTEVVPKVMIANKDLLRKVGINIDTVQLDWDSLYSICKSVTADTNHDGTIDRFGVVDYTWDTAAYSNGQQLFQGTSPELYTSEFYNSISYYQKIQYLNNGQIPKESDFIKGNAAFLITDFSTVLSNYKYPYNVMNSYSFDWKCIGLPMGPDNTKQVQPPIETVMYGINSASRNMDRAWDFLKFIVYDEDSQIIQLLYSNTLSARKGINLSRQVDTIMHREFGDVREGVDLRDISRLIEESGEVPSFTKYKESYDRIDSAIRTSVYERTFNRSTLMDLQNEIKQSMK